MKDLAANLKKNILAGKVLIVFFSLSYSWNSTVITVADITQ